MISFHNDINNAVENFQVKQKYQIIKIYLQCEVLQGMFMVTMSEVEIKQGNVVLGIERMWC